MPRKALFVCGKARMRSPTAADLAEAMDGVTADFAGLSSDADERLSSEHIEWADIIFVMERRQKMRLMALFGGGLADKTVRVLGILDKYANVDPELVRLLKPKLDATLAG